MNITQTQANTSHVEGKIRLNNVAYSLMTWLNVEGLERYRVTHKKVHSSDVIYLEHVISQKSAIHTKGGHTVNTQ